MAAGAVGDMNHKISAKVGVAHYPLSASTFARAVLFAEVRG